MSSTGEIDELTRASSFVFSGTVEGVGASNVPLVESSDSTLLVRIDRALRVDSALGDVRGRVVTLETAAAQDLPPGTAAVFFTDSLVYGEELAVRERAHVAADRADQVAAAVERLPDLHLADRLRAAAAVVHAAVTRAALVPGLPLERRSPWWAEATFDVLETLKGDAAGMRLFFPTNESHHWYLAPRFTAGQRTVVLLHVNDAEAGDWLHDPVLSGGVTALDPADVQPEARLADVRALLQEGETT